MSTISMPQPIAEPASHYRTISSTLLGLSRRNCLPIHAVTEVDITGLLAFKRRHGHTVSSILIKAIADTLVSRPDFRPLNSVLRRGLLRDVLVSWDSVSVSVALDRTYEGERVAAVYEIREVEKRSLEDVDAELRRVQQMQVEDLPIHARLGLLQRFPTLVSRALVRLLAALAGIDRLSPASIGFTNIGPGAIQAVFPISSRTLMFGIGGQTKRVVETVPGHFESRPFLSISLCFNHYAVDGALCNAFLTDLRRRLESV